jgi:hypothetical protein
MPLPSGQMSDGEFANTLVKDELDYDQFVSDALPRILDRAAGHVRRFLRGTGQWQDDVDHEKFALRWGYELLERFLLSVHSELPCRPVLLLDSMVAKFLSQPDPLLYQKDLTTPLGRLIDGLAYKAVLSRDALMALFYHFFGYTQGQVERLLALPDTSSHRVYKNFERWRQTGWQQVLNQIGLTESEIARFEDEKRHAGSAFNDEAERLIRMVQNHYRKSEPEHYSCKTAQEWAVLFEENCQFDYRCWHLPMCVACTERVYKLRQRGLEGIPPPRIDLRFRPIARGTFPHAAGLGQGGRNGARRGT